MHAFRSLMFYPRGLIENVQEDQRADKDAASVADDGGDNDLRSKLERAEAEIERLTSSEC